MLVMLAEKHTKNACLLCDHSHHAARGVPAEDTLVRTPLWLTMMKAFLSRNGLPNPKLADGKASGGLALCPHVSIFSTPLQGHHPVVNSLLDWRKLIIWLMKHGDGKRTLKLGLIVTNGIQTPKKKPTESLAKRDPGSLYASRETSAATNSTPEWHPMVRGLIPQ
ncbi:hypothetical protein O181_130254 [Austropuccinia psidii MF-1]|uniref:Uncharacterized protein n=1 Tax=Austropuccinia psidii MF-1 TaxID=1389203 RepID=A0A9Q3Q9X0_9BASI|nr:hypothetical protein [Austropuccinia psidii MF-1]